MLYRLLKIWARFTLLLFCKKITIRNRERLDTAQPLIIAANHPNSFLDAIIIDCIFSQPVTALARGDAFANDFLRKLFKALHMLPIFRSSEGRDNLPANYRTFEICQQLLKDNGTILLFSEGKCINEWHLRPLMKGTARLAVQCWDQDIPVQVLPLALNYHSFQQFGKHVIIQPGAPFGSEVLQNFASEGNKYQEFNRVLSERLQTGVLEIGKDDFEKRNQQFALSSAGRYRILLFFPAVIGWVIHQPLYFPLRKVLRKLCRDNDHYDSALFGGLMLLYPLYLLLLCSLAGYFANFLVAVILLAVIPFTAWSWKEFKSIN